MTYPLTLGLRGLRGVRVVRSSSDVGFSMISVIFDDGVVLGRGRRRVAERLACLGGQLPAGATPELAPDAPATGQIFWYTVEGRGFDLGRLRASRTGTSAPARLRPRRGRRRRASAGSRSSTRSPPTPTGCALWACRSRDVVRAVSGSNAASGGHLLHKGNAEYVVRGVALAGRVAHAR